MMEVRRIRYLASDRPLEFQTGSERDYPCSELLALPGQREPDRLEIPSTGGALQRCGRVVRPKSLQFRASIRQPRYCPLCGFRGGCNFRRRVPSRDWGLG